MAPGPSDARNAVPCRRCGKPVIWATLPSLKRAPFDAEFDPLEGTHVLSYRATYNVVFADPVDPSNPEDGARARRNHLKACPFVASDPQGP